jgi:hypothetical protein
MVWAMMVQAPLLLGKNPALQTRQVNGDIEVALAQFGSETSTQEVTPLVVWRPNPSAQLAQALIEVNVKQLVAAGTIQAVELRRKKPLAH